MRLSRRYARLSLALTGIGILAIPVGLLAGGASGLLVGGGAFVLLYILGSAIQLHFLRCPNCGKAVLPAKWSSREPVLCSKCKTHFIWDN